METAEKLMTAEKLENLTAQLKSSSEEDQVLTLNIIDNYDVQNNLLFFLLLKKRSNTNWSLWEKHASKATEILFQYVDKNQNLTYQYMIGIAAKHKADVKQLQYFMNDFGGHLKEVLESYGYDFIETVSITLKPKVNDTSRDSS